MNMDNLEATLEKQQSINSLSFIRALMWGSRTVFPIAMQEVSRMKVTFAHNAGIFPMVTVLFSPRLSCAFEEGSFFP